MTRIYGQLIYVHTYAQMCMQHLRISGKGNKVKTTKKQKDA